MCASPHTVFLWSDKQRVFCQLTCPFKFLLFFKNFTNLKQLATHFWNYLSKISLKIGK